MLTFCWILLDSNAHILTTGSFSVYFQFTESRIVITPSHKWHHKQAKIIFLITKFTVSEGIYAIECTYIRIELYWGPDKFYWRSKFGQYDKEKNLAPLTKLANGRDIFDVSFETAVQNLTKLDLKQ